uniref:Tctex1 domain containing 2 n=1 Tax=Sphaeramia orbicularis TaxID=375764 RepID=A0A672YR70_9TELE
SMSIIGCWVCMGSNVQNYRKHLLIFFLSSQLLLNSFRFKPAVVKEYIREIVRDRLSGVRYNPEEVPELYINWLCSVSVSTDAGLDRYKLVVQVVIGEQRGQGVKMSSRCLWDADTDNYAEDVFMNVSNMFCVAAVFGSYYY